MADLRKRFGKLVAAHRRRKGMTQLQLAEAADLSNTMIVRIEAGSTGARFPSIERIADALGVDPSELFLAGSARQGRVRSAMADVTVRLAPLSDDELHWVGEVLDVVMRR